MTNETMIDSNEKQVQHQFHLMSSGDEEDERPISMESTNSHDDQPVENIPENETFEDEKMNKLCQNWLTLDEELRAFEGKHKIYVGKLDEVESLKTQYRDEFNKYSKKVSQLQKDVKLLKKLYTKNDEQTKKTLINTNRKNSLSSVDLSTQKSLSRSISSNIYSLTSVNSSPSLDKLANTLSSIDRLTLISDQLNASALNLCRISETLPRKDPYLKVILGGVDVSILNKVDRWKYKEEYEKFKFIITLISFISSIVIWSLTSRYRAFDAMFHFLLVWYYCTLTIRESILIVNGSNINPWWRAHHFISTVATGILLTWPESHSYHSFRTQFFIFSFYLSFVQGLQFYYQRGCLYRLRALGETPDMEITIEGFHRWMFRGLSFIVPFLIVGYLFQFYNAYTLWKLAQNPTTHEWQVLVLSVIFFVLCMGNILTTINVLREKFREKPRPILLREKYQSLKEFLKTNYHQRTRSWNQSRGREKQLKKNEDLKKAVSKLE